MGNSTSLVSHWNGKPSGWDCSFSTAWTPMIYSIYFTYLHQPVGKIKKRTAACRPHTERTSICAVIVMLKWRHHVASLRIQIFLKAFFTFLQYKMLYLVVSKKSNTLFAWGLDRKIRPSRLPFVICPSPDANRWWSVRIFLSHPHTHDKFL